MALQAVLERRFLWSSQRGEGGRLATTLRGLGSR
jgi:hypothetical protein